MSLTFGTVIVQDSVVGPLRKCAQLCGADTDGMWIVGLSATGTAPPTHWISTGRIPSAFAQALSGPVPFWTFVNAACVAAGVSMPYTQAQVTNAYAKCDVSQDQPFDAMARMGLQIVQNT